MLCFALSDISFSPPKHHVGLRYYYFAHFADEERGTDTFKQPARGYTAGLGRAGTQTQAVQEGKLAFTRALKGLRRLRVTWASDSPSGDLH